MVQSNKSAHPCLFLDLKEKLSYYYVPVDGTKIQD